MAKKKRPLLDIQQVNLLEGAALEKFCAEFSDEDRARARALVRKYLGRPGLALLGIEPKPRKKPLIRLNAQSQDEKYIEAQIIKLTRASEAEARRLTAALEDGTITADEWYVAMTINLKALYLAIALLALEDEDDDDGALLVLLAPLILAQIQWLNKFAKGMADGTIPMDGKAIVRAGMYALAGWAIYQQMKKYAMMRAGYTIERRVLGAAEHCPDCVEYAARGWQPIGTLPMIGQSKCRSHCHCRFEYDGKMNLGVT